MNSYDIFDVTQTSSGLWAWRKITMFANGRTNETYNAYATLVECVEGLLAHVKETQ